MNKQQQHVVDILTLRFAEQLTYVVTIENIDGSIRFIATPDDAARGYTMVFEVGSRGGLSCWCNGLRAVRAKGNDAWHLFGIIINNAEQRPAA